jgi:hypothetical protein
MLLITDNTTAMPQPGCGGVGEVLPCYIQSANLKLYAARGYPPTIAPNCAVNDLRVQKFKKIIKTKGLLDPFREQRLFSGAKSR